MNRTRQSQSEFFAWGTRPRILVLAVLAALPGVIHAQTLPPLQIDPRLLGGAPVVPAKPAQSQPVEPPAPAALAPATSAAPSRQVAPSPSTPAVAAPAVAPAPAPVPKAAPAETPKPVVTKPAAEAAPQQEAQAAKPATSTVVLPIKERPPAAAPEQPAPARTDGLLALQPSGKRASVVVVPKGGDGKQPDPTRATMVEAEHINGHDQVDMTAQGSVRMERSDLVMTSDQLYYDQVGNEVTAEGNVHIEHGADAIDGPKAHMNLDTWYGEIDSPTYRLQRQRKLTRESWPLPGRPEGPATQLVSGSGYADLLKLEGENHYRLKNSTYTTCPAPNPSWYLRMTDLQLDFDRDKGEARNSTLVFKGVPVAYMPWAEFPLSGGRQSGFLPPTIGGTNSTGFDTTVPYYFNLAPNYDATLAPRYMSDRGTQLGGEFRYLTPDAKGTLRGEYLDTDKITQTSRSLAVWKHTQNFGNGFSGSVDASQVSDKTYFADLSSKIATTSQSTLNQQANLAYNSDSWFSSAMTVQRYQVISGDAPYNRMPQISANANWGDLHGLSLTVPTEYTDFTHPTLDEGRRLVMSPQVSYPIQTSSFFLTPSFGVHMMRYDITRRSTTGNSEISTVIPTMSLDSGLVFERETKLGGQDQIHTLEPRVYYVRTPYRDQSQIPVFDTSVADFNFAQIFSDNRYVGKDRVSDANQLTAGIQSRMINAASGEEWLRTALAQRYYFADQKVTLPSETARTGRAANILGAVSGQVVHSWWLDNAAEYDQREQTWQRGTTQLRYQPESGKVASVAYRYNRGNYRDLDLSAQWPLWGSVYAVGRYDRNLRDHRLSESIAGVEYKGDCWVLRSVWQSLLTTSETRSNSFYLQLEFNGLASLGSNPVNVLKRSVNGYGKINDPSVGDPMFGDSTQP